MIDILAVRNAVIKPRPDQPAQNFEACDVRPSRYRAALGQIVADWRYCRSPSLQMAEFSVTRHRGQLGCRCRLGPVAIGNDGYVFGLYSQ